MSRNNSKLRKSTAVTGQYNRFLAKGKHSTAGARPELPDSQNLNAVHHTTAAPFLFTGSSKENGTLFGHLGRDWNRFYFWDITVHTAAHWSVGPDRARIPTGTAATVRGSRLQISAAR